MRTRKTARPAMTLKVYQVGGAWLWRIWTDHNNASIASSQSEGARPSFPTQAEATSDGSRVFHMLRQAA